jgi:hypothetical protein
MISFLLHSYCMGLHSRMCTSLRFYLLHLSHWINSNKEYSTFLLKSCLNSIHALAHTLTQCALLQSYWRCRPCTNSISSLTLHASKWKNLVRINFVFLLNSNTLFSKPLLLLLNRRWFVLKESLPISFLSA